MFNEEMTSKMQPSTGSGTVNQEDLGTTLSWEVEVGGGENLVLLVPKAREDEGDREARHPPYTPYSIGNLSRVIFKTTDPKRD